MGLATMLARLWASDLLRADEKKRCHGQAKVGFHD
jgi:hypothetical protein